MSDGALKIKQVIADVTDIIADIKQCSFFEEFPPNLWDHLFEISEVVNFKAGDIVVREGEVNRFLYFLLTGKISVLIGDDKASKLQRKGDLIGGMGVISQRPSTSSYCVDTPTEMLKININDIKSLPEPGPEYFEQNLYKYFAVMLTEKLEFSADQNKKFEMVIRELEDAQHVLQNANKSLEDKVQKRTKELQHKHDLIHASHQKLEELYGLRELTVRKLHDLYTKHLIPLEKNLGYLKNKIDYDSQQRFVEVVNEIVLVNKMLNPLSDLYMHEQAMKSKKLLLLESNKKDQIQAKMSLGGSGVDMHLASNIEDGEKEIEQNHFDIICSNSEFIELTEKAYKKKSDTKIVYLMDENHLDYIEKLKKYPNIQNIIFKPNDNNNFAIKNFSATISKLVTRDYFGLQKYLNWGTEVQEFPITKSDERKWHLNNMDDYFNNLGLRSSLRDAVKTVSEELLMNAIYDAPITSDNEPRYNHLPRTIKVTLEPHEYGVLKYACDGVLVGVSVEDPFGKLTKDTVLAYLESCSTGKAGLLNIEKGGAGLGLFQLITLSDLTVFNVHPNHRTEVIVLFNIIRKNIEKGKFSPFHFFTY